MEGFDKDGIRYVSVMMSNECEVLKYKEKDIQILDISDFASVSLHRTFLISINTNRSLSALNSSFDFLSSMKAEYSLSSNSTN
jgi:hypothetical protein